MAESKADRRVASTAALKADWSDERTAVERVPMLADSMAVQKVA